MLLYGPYGCHSNRGLLSLGHKDSEFCCKGLIQLENLSIQFGSGIPYLVLNFTISHVTRHLFFVIAHFAFERDVVVCLPILFFFRLHT